VKSVISPRQYLATAAALLAGMTCCFLTISRAVWRPPSMRLAIPSDIQAVLFTLTSDVHSIFIPGGFGRRHPFSSHAAGSCTHRSSRVPSFAARIAADNRVNDSRVSPRRLCASQSYRRASGIPLSPAKALTPPARREAA
jgi:hypothetical protein